MSRYIKWVHYTMCKVIYSVLYLQTIYHYHIHTVHLELTDASDFCLCISLFILIKHPNHEN